MSSPASTVASHTVSKQAGRYSIESLGMWAILVTLIVAIGIVTPFSILSLSVTKSFVLAAGAIIALALYIFARLSRGSMVLPPAMLVCALWLPAIAYVLSAVFSGAPFANALWGTALEPDTLGFILTATLLATLSALVLRRPEQYRSFFKAGAALFVVIAVLEVCIVLVGQFAPSTISPAFSIVGSFEDLALFLGLGVVGTLITIRFFEVSRRVRQVLSVAVALSLFLLAIANSSFVWVLLALVSFGLFIETVMMRKGAIDEDLDDVVVVDEASLESDVGTRSALLPLVVLAASLFFLVGGALGGALANMLHVNILSVSPSWQSTFSVAQQTYHTAPIFGSGPGTFGSEWLKYRDASLNATMFWNVDFSSGIGFIPTSFVTTGLLGALAWIAFFALFIVFGLRMLIMRTPKDAYVRYVAILSFVASLYLFSAAVFRLPNIVIIALAFVFAGIFASTMRFAVRGEQWGIIFSRSPRIGFVIVFSLTLVLLSSVVVAYNVVGRYMALVELSNANSAFSAGDLDKAERAVQNSVSLAPSAAAYQAQANIAIVRLRQIVTSTTMPVAEAQKAFQATLSAGINAALTAKQLAPSDYQNWLVLGNLYAQAVPLNVEGAYDSAKMAFERARELSPTNPEILYIMAQLDLAHKDSKAAQANLQAAIALKQDYTDAIFLLSQLLVQDGNIKEALASANSAAYFAPRDPAVLFQVGVLRAASGDLPGAVSALSDAINANAQFANARYFLAAVYTKQGKLQDAIAQLQAIADLSSDNAKSVKPLIATLQKGKNPFPDNLLAVPSSSVK